MNPVSRFLGRYAIWVYSALAFAFLLVPILYTIVFSFNDYRRSNIVWRGFTLENWIYVCDEQDVCESFVASVGIGAIATVVATALGTMIAIALVRYRFRFRSTITLLLFLPMATPEIVLGTGMASQFLGADVTLGPGTVVLAHILFCISFVVVTVRARVESLDPSIEEAGRDLYGSPAQVFWRVTFPLLLPGIIAAALLSFALSFDDYIITTFNAGPAFKTFPLYLYGAASRGMPAEANVIASAVFFIAIAVVIATQLSGAAARKRLARQ